MLAAVVQITVQLKLNKTKKKLSMKNWMQNNKLYFIGALLGAIAGFIYWKYVGCLTGTCAITSNPLRSAAYFALFGALIIGSLKKERNYGKTDNQ